MLELSGKFEEAFDVYKSVFDTDYITPIARMGEIFPRGSEVDLSDFERNGLVNMELSVVGSHLLMAGDMIDSLGQKVSIGNSTTTNLELDDVDGARDFHEALSQGAIFCAQPSQTPWTSLWGAGLDRFGIRWMFNVILQN